MSLDFSANKVRANARKAERGLLGPDLFAGPGWVAGDAAAWAVGHLSERQAVFGHADLLAATPAREPGAVTVDAAERAIAALEREGGLHAARGLDHDRHWTTDAALARESETIALMRAGQGPAADIRPDVGMRGPPRRSEGPGGDAVGERAMRAYRFHRRRACMMVGGDRDMRRSARVRTVPGEPLGGRWRSGGMMSLST